jgi:G3E family GTPase
MVPIYHEVNFLKRSGKMKKPVYIMSGFLGSGKTTVLLNLIEACKKRNQKPAIILNELGSVNVESHLFEDQRVIEILDGCICCTIQSNFKETLDQLIKDQETFDVLFIEGTGVANPIELMEVLLQPSFSKVFDIFSIISVIDGGNFLSHLSIFSSSSELIQLLKDQIQCATYIVMNKLDQVSKNKLHKIEEKLHQLVSAEVPIHFTTFGKVPFDEVFMKRFSVNYLSHERNGAAREHDHHHHHGSIAAVRIENVSTTSKRMLTKWLNSLPNELYRAKGIVRLEGKEDFYQVQYSPKNVRMDPIRTRNQNMIPSMIFIGEHFAIQKIKEQFEHEFSS